MGHDSLHILHLNWESNRLGRAPRRETEASPDCLVTENSREACRRILRCIKARKDMRRYQQVTRVQSRSYLSSSLNKPTHNPFSRTFIFQSVTSLWQSEVQTILILTSCGIGGSTVTSSITRGSPGFRHTAAATSPQEQTTSFKTTPPYFHKIQTSSTNPPQKNHTPASDQLPGGRRSLATLTLHFVRTQVWQTLQHGGLS